MAARPYLRAPGKRTLHLPLVAKILENGILFECVLALVVAPRVLHGDHGQGAKEAELLSGDADVVVFVSVAVDDRLSNLGQNRLAVWAEPGRGMGRDTSSLGCWASCRVLLKLM